MICCKLLPCIKTVFFFLMRCKVVMDSLGQMKKLSKWAIFENQDGLLATSVLHDFCLWNQLQVIHRCYASEAPSSTMWQLGWVVPNSLGWQFLKLHQVVDDWSPHRSLHAFLFCTSNPGISRVWRYVNRPRDWLRLCHWLVFHRYIHLLLAFLHYTCKESPWSILRWNGLKRGDFKQFYFFWHMIWFTSFSSIATRLRHITSD